MPYLQVEVDAIDLFGQVATMSGMDEGAVTSGLLKLWRYCWRKKTAYVARELLESFFRGDIERLIRALVACEFLARFEDRSDLLVRGAAKRLGIQKAQSEGGKRNAGQLRQYMKSTSGLPPGDPVGEPARDPEVDPDPSRTLKPALTPNTQHPTPNIKTTLSSKMPDELPSASPPEGEGPGNGTADQESLLTPAEAESTSAVARVLAHYIAAMAANGKEVRDTPKRRKLIAARLKEKHAPEELMDAISGLTWSDYHMGKGYTDIEYAIRDAGQIDMMLARLKTRGAA